MFEELQEIIDEFGERLDEIIAKYSNLAETEDFEPIVSEEETEVDFQAFNEEAMNAEIEQLENELQQVFDEVAERLI